MYIPSIRSDNFELEVMKEKRPVLLACPHAYFEFIEQKEVLKSISKEYEEELKVCLLSEDFIGVFREKYGVEGTPTFLVFVGGKEKKRLLGKASREALIAFLSQTLPYLKESLKISYMNY